MARSLGGGGGRSFGGGHIGGSRSFGGSHPGGSSTRRVSSSSRSSGSSYSRRPSSGYRPGGGMPPPPPRYRNTYRRSFYGGPVIVNRGGGGRPSGCGSGCGSTVLIVFLIVLIIGFVGVFKQYKDNTTDNYGSGGKAGSNVGYGCEKYTGKVDSSHGYWKDDSTGSDKWIDSSNSSYLEEGFSSFYNKTGVYPFLYVVDNYGDKAARGDFGTYEEKVYADLFGDCPGNLLFVFVSNEESYYIAAGTGTGSVVNDKTVPNVIQSRITNYWNSSSMDGDLAKIFGNALSSSATQLMKEAETSKLASNNFKVIMIVLISVIGVVVILLILMSWWKKKKQAQKEADERLEQILSQPLSTFGNEEIHNLGQKYSGGNGGGNISGNTGGNISPNNPNDPPQ